MRYMLLVYAEEKAKANWIPAQWDNHMAAYVKFTQDLQRAGKMLGGEAFHPVSQATTVRIQLAGTVPTPGPYEETREQLGGYYMIEADDIDDAVFWAAQIPDAKLGSVEIRPIMEFDQ